MHITTKQLRELKAGKHAYAKPITGTFVIDIVPMGAVRQTQADKWKQRPCVLRYREYCDKLREKMHGLTLPNHGYHVTFYLPIPPYHSAKKRAEMEGAPHCQKPDKDNLEKALLDALMRDDKAVWDGRVTKRWSERPRIEITVSEVA